MHKTPGGLLRRGQTETTTNVSDEEAEALKEALRCTFLNVDKALIEHCAAKKLHYASCTGVTCFLWKNLLTVAHVGDSKACIAKLIGEDLHPEWLTVDHKPNMPLELKRIEANGGSLAWLHGNKPYIRYVCVPLHCYRSFAILIPPTPLRIGGGISFVARPQANIRNNLTTAVHSAGRI